MIFRKPTGKCAGCGRSTKLLVHENCGGGRDRKPRKRTYRGRDLTQFLRRVGE